MKTLKINTVEEALALVGKKVRSYDFPFNGEGDDTGERATFVDGEVLGVSKCGVIFSEEYGPTETFTSPAKTLEEYNALEGGCFHLTIFVEAETRQGIPYSDKATVGRVGDTVNPPASGILANNGCSTVALIEG